jgi:cell division protein FtsB
LVILLGFLANVKYQQYRIQKSIENEKNNLSQQAASLEKRNQELSQSLSYLSSSDFKEKVAREQLGLKREGEIVFDFSRSEGQTEVPSAEAALKGKSNFQKWWVYFTQTP